MIVIVDYGAGNPASVQNMLRKAGGDAVISGDPQQVLAAEKLILPGVGHFDHGMKRLGAAGLRPALDRYALELRRPLLGICLGAQMFGHGSEEGVEAGLGWLDMRCRRLPASPGLRVPHMGWSQIAQKKRSPLLDGMPPDARYYFVHSYCMHCTDPADVLATAAHGVEFVCAVQRGNIFGTQFHPEKSLRHGLALMRAFVEMSPA